MKTASVLSWNVELITRREGGHDGSSSNNSIITHFIPQKLLPHATATVGSGASDLPTSRPNPISFGVVFLHRAGLLFSTAILVAPSH